MAPSHAPSQKCLRDARRNSAASRLGSDRSACRRVSAALQPHWPAMTGPTARTTRPLFYTATRPASYVLPKLLLTGLLHLVLRISPVPLLPGEGPSPNSRRRAWRREPISRASRRSGIVRSVLARDTRRVLGQIVGDREPRRLVDNKCVRVGADARI